MWVYTLGDFEGKETVFQLSAQLQKMLRGVTKAPNKPKEESAVATQKKPNVSRNSRDKVTKYINITDIPDSEDALPVRISPTKQASQAAEPRSRMISSSPITYREDKGDASPPMRRIAQPVTIRRSAVDDDETEDYNDGDYEKPRYSVGRPKATFVPNYRSSEGYADRLRDDAADDDDRGGAPATGAKVSIDSAPRQISLKQNNPMPSEAAGSAYDGVRSQAQVRQHVVHVAAPRSGAAGGGGGDGVSASVVSAHRAVPASHHHQLQSAMSRQQQAHQDEQDDDDDWDLDDDQDDYENDYKQPQQHHHASSVSAAAPPQHRVAASFAPPPPAKAPKPSLHPEPRQQAARRHDDLDDMHNSYSDDEDEGDAKIGSYQPQPTKAVRSTHVSKKAQPAKPQMQVQEHESRKSEQQQQQQRQAQRAYDTPQEQLYFSKEPRPVHFRPYSLEQYRATKPQAYVEISNLKPGNQ